MFTAITTPAALPTTVAAPVITAAPLTVEVAGAKATAIANNAATQAAVETVRRALNAAHYEHGLI